MDIGTWVKAGTFVGRVARIEDDGTTVLFNPGDRQMLRATPGTLQHLPTGSVDVTVTTRVDVPHGLTEDSLRRWIAAQLDPGTGAAGHREPVRVRSRPGRLRTGGGRRRPGGR